MNGQFVRKFDLDDYFLDRIDTEEKAYFLGFAYADGYNDGKCFSINLQKNDMDILQKISKIIKFTGKLHYKDYSKYKIKNRDTSNWKNQYILRFTSERICIKLTELGCPPKKSLILKFPTIDIIPINLMRHFIRGYMDGDGTIGKSFLKTRNHIQFNCEFCSTENFCNGMKNFLIKNNINSWIYDSHNNGITKTFKVSGNKQILRFLDWIYSDATIYLDRKFKSYLQLKETYYKPKYKIINPYGEIFLEKELKTFCINKNINYGCMTAVAQGKRKHHKKWTVERLQDTVEK